MSELDPLYLMKNADKAGAFLLKALKDVDRYEAGLSKVVDALENDDVTPETVAKFSRTTAKIVRDQQILLKHLILFTMTYLGGDQFNTDIAVVANKMGRGDEALREMFNRKLNGG